MIRICVEMVILVRFLTSSLDRETLSNGFEISFSKYIRDVEEQIYRQSLEVTHRH